MNPPHPSQQPEPSTSAQSGLATEHYMVLGNPIAHSRSPWIHTRFAELTGQTAMTYSKHLTPLDGFAATVAMLRQQGVKGCNVTVPFKFEAFALATRRTVRAELAGACNTLTFEQGEVLGDNTDGTGLVRDVTANAGVPLRGTRILLLGAGGAAAGVLGPMLSEQPSEMVVCNRTAAKAEALVASHASFAKENNCELKSVTSEALEGVFDVIFNATASSLGGGDVPAPDRVLRPGALVVDLMYGPAAQPFLDWAKQHGAQGRDGLGMLVEQAATAFELWRGMRPPSAQVLAELRALLSPAQS